MRHCCGTQGARAQILGWLIYITVLQEDVELRERSRPGRSLSRSRCAIPNRRNVHA